MGGVTVNLMSKTRLEYSWLAPAAFTTLIVRPAIATSRFYTVYLWVRVHEKNLAGGGQRIIFGLYNTYPSREDPREFSESSLFAGISMASGTTAPELLSSSVATSPGPYLKFVIEIYQDTSVADILYTQVSAGVVLREH